MLFVSAAPLQPPLIWTMPSYCACAEMIQEVSSKTKLMARRTNNNEVKLLRRDRKTEEAAGKQKVCGKTTESDELFHGGHY